PMPGGGRHGGRPDQIRALTVREIQDRLDRHYKPRNATLALAGDFDPAAARRMIEAHFAAPAAGEEIPPPREPGAPRFAVAAPANKGARAAESIGEPTACLAYLAPRPGSALYAPFLVLVSRLWSGASQLGGSGATGSPVFFTPLDDGSVVAISATFRPGETQDQVFQRIEKFVAEATGPSLGADEPAAVKQRLGLLVGLGDLPDAALGLNPYGVAFSLARRDQLGLDSARLNRALESVTDADLKRVVVEVFASSRHAGAVAGAGGAGR
ncbi:MAG TPA: insulinase family protein, partial [Acidimicrobiales bacterium]|nr:insulinase family protein [Acidimicrobiales bacterium]